MTIFQRQRKMLPSAHPGQDRRGERQGKGGMEKFYHLLDLCVKHHTFLGMSFLSLLTAGGERLFSSVVFQCPCSATWNLPYSITFFLLPALILFSLGCVLSSQAGKLVTGCCAQDPGDEHNGSCCQTKRQPCKKVAKWCRIFLIAAVAPVTWIAVAFLGGDFFACAASASSWAQKSLCDKQYSGCLGKVANITCQKQISGPTEAFLKELRAVSQVAGWSLIALMTVAFVIFKSCTSCTSPVSFLHFRFLKIYEKKEQEILKTEMKRLATEMAKKNVNYFFKNSYEKEDIKIPNPTAWKEISAVYEIDENYCSSLHEYVLCGDAKDGNSAKTQGQSHPESQAEEVAPSQDLA
ncbi:calcium homeostasis modulator protein 6-like [Gracilinanus agilis]|uniref:calcium homeostasis modulator protein 6-like n=1 Tax=Gracilinanus agilis TaxID=191870 RepID=UPI001CFD266B|nr:calcium homeostasis modulator protein 6-like [Gracilinanus agilis]